jgi:transposase
MQFRSEQEYLAFDITSISSYSKLIETLEYGYNRDGEGLPQINMGMLFGQTSMLPVFYSIYPGSIRDINTLENMITYIKYLSLQKVRFVMDKGFYSHNNMREMLQKGVKFAVSMPFTTKLAKSLADGSRKGINSAIKSFVINDDVIYADTARIQIGGKNVTAFIYYNERQYIDAKESILKRIARLEQILKEKRLVPSTIKDVTLKFLKIRHSKKGLIIHRDEKKIEEILKYKGFNIIISNDFRDAQEVLHLYRSKDSVEKVFDNMKNELDLKRLRVHSDDAMRGRIFLCFIALILYAWLDKKMKDKNLYKIYTQEEVMSELKKLKIVEFTQTKRILTEITKTQKVLLKAFDIPEPSETLL